MKTLQTNKKGLFSGFLNLILVSIFTFGFAGVALASTPNLSVSNNGNNQVQISVTNADPNSTINLYYNSGNFVANIGTTNSSGYFSTTLNQNSYSIPQNSYVYVMVNGQNSSSVLWPYNGNNYGNISLSQTSLTIAYNQSASVSIYGGNGSYYISSNSNSSIASASISGSTLNVSAYSSIAGNTTITVCSYNTSGCATLYVYVQSGYYNQPTYLSPSTLSLNAGQGQAVTISGSGSYSLSTNSNPTSISALISGSVLNVYGSAPGTGTLTVCSTSGSGGCANLYVTIGGSYNYNNYNGYTNYYGYNNSYYNPGYTYSNGGYNTYYVQGTSDQTPYYSAVSSTGSQVYLNQVPATGISFANLKTILFTLGLIFWSMFAAYIFMAKQKRKVLRQ